MEHALCKCLSAGSAATLRVDGHPHDYRHHGNREFLLASGTTAVKLWVSWYDLQASRRPASWQESWRQLNEAPGDLPARAPFSAEPALRNLDRQIAAANADGLAVILALDECSPPWAVAREAAILPQGLGRYLARETGASPPLDRSPTGPWGWFVDHLCARYRPDAAPNPIGPRRPEPGDRCDGYDPFVGNPEGAHIDALEICREPNVRWPQPGAAQAAAEMIRSAAEIAAHHGELALLAPSLSDLSGKWLRGRYGDGTPLHVFARQLLRELRSWTPPAYVGWSQHTYGDMGRAEIEGIVQALELLGQYGWHDSTSSLWLTEGAVATPDPAKLTVGEALEYERLQADLVRLNYELLCEVDEVRLWTYHTFHDLESEPAKTGLRQDFDWERQQPGAEKLAWDRFVELPGEVEFSLPDRVPAVAVPAA